MTSTRAIVILAAALSIGLGSAGCTTYNRVEDGKCAETCLGSFVGICPTSLVVSKGELKTGACSALGYTVKGDDLKQKAGPCGTLTFTTYTKPGADLIADAVADAAAHAQYIAGLGSSGGSGCPKVTPIDNLNLTEWVRATWYIQEQQVTGYQKEEDLYCVSATYDVQPSRKVPFFGGEVVSVYNYAEENAVNGKSTNPNNKTILCARVPDAQTPSKLLVAPCFLPNLLAGDYWILAAGPSPDNYEWAIISGGQPSVKYDDGCTTKETGTNGSGFWLFSRSPVADAAQMAAIKQKAKDLGFTLSRLHPVAQAGCKREGAFIKKNE